MASIIDRADAISNAKRRVGSIGPGEAYLFAELKDGEDLEPLLFTEHEINVASMRAARNVEDVDAALLRAARRQLVRRLAVGAALLAWSLACAGVGAVIGS